MPKHIVTEGEHFAAIAAQHGFPSAKIAMDLPENKELREKRKNLHVLAEGDEVFIPEKELRQEEAAVNQKHVFAAQFDELILRFRVLDLSERTVTRSAEVTVDSAGKKTLLPKDDKGVFEAEIAPTDKQATVRFGDASPVDMEREYRLQIGGLQDPSTPEGKRHRLNNLGYLAGFSKKVDEKRMQWAIEEFKRDHRQKHGFKKNDATDEGTKLPDALVKEHGV